MYRDFLKVGGSRGPDRTELINQAEFQKEIRGIQREKSFEKRALKLLHVHRWLTQSLVRWLREQEKMLDEVVELQKLIEDASKNNTIAADAIAQMNWKDNPILAEVIGDKQDGVPTYDEIAQKKHLLGEMRDWIANRQKEVKRGHKILKRFENLQEQFEEKKIVARLVTAGEFSDVMESYQKFVTNVVFPAFCPPNTQPEDLKEVRFEEEEEEEDLLHVDTSLKTTDEDESKRRNYGGGTSESEEEEEEDDLPEEDA